VIVKKRLRLVCLAFVPMATVFGLTCGPRFVSSIQNTWRTREIIEVLRSAERMELVGELSLLDGGEQRLSILFLPPSISTPSVISFWLDSKGTAEFVLSIIRKRKSNY
jgi:hypothetical protein